MIDKSVLKKLSELQTRKTVIAILFDWALIVGAAMTSEWARNPWVYLLAIAIIGGRMHAFGALIHEFAHYRVIRNKTLSDYIGNIVVGWPIFFTIGGYRLNHLAHHRYLNTDQDPDWTAKVGTRKFTFPQEKRTMVRSLLEYLVVVGTIADLSVIVPRLSKKGTATRAEKYARLGFYAALATVLTVFGAWMLFLKYWIVPFLTFFFLFLYVRSVAEHFGSLEYEDEITGTRTVIPHHWEKLFFSPHNVGYHLEHHLYPNVPYYNLPALHDELMKDDEFRARGRITKGYTTGLMRECLLPEAAVAS